MYADEQNGCVDTCPAEPTLPLLNYYTFYPFMRNTDAALVLFYDGGEKPAEKRWYMAQLLMAAKINERPNTAFVAVDCSSDKLLCMEEQVPCNPLIRVYSGVKAIGNFKDKSDVNPKKLKDILETTRSPPKCGSC